MLCVSLVQPLALIAQLCSAVQRHAFVWQSEVLQQQLCLYHQFCQHVYVTVTCHQRLTIKKKIYGIIKAIKCNMCHEVFNSAHPEVNIK
jgi:hypothetical protein